MPARAGAARPDPRLGLSAPPPSGAPPHPVGVTLVHWNQARRCVATVAAFRAQGPDVDLLIVDNGSTPDHLAVLDRELPDVPVVRLGANRGFGAAANAGLRHFLARQPEPRYLVVAPHDALPAPDCLDRIVAELDARPAAGLACADVGDGHVPVVDPYFGGMTVPARQAEGWEPADYPHGTLLVARPACLRGVGLFDEGFFAYCEEADLGIRAREAGWEIGLVHGARVVNPTMRSGSAAVDYLMQRNTLFLVRRHSGRYHATIRLLIAVVQLLQGLVGRGRPPFLFVPRARARAMRDFLLGRWGPPPPDVPFDPVQPA